MVNLSGIFPPLPTAFNDDESLASDRMASNISILSKFDLSGFLILGSNGESVNLSEEEKKEVYHFSREAIPKDKLILAGTGAQSTIETVRLTKYAAKAGADVALVLNPSFYKGLMSKAALVKHYYKVADSSEIPIVIYNMPANSGLDMDADTIIEISQHKNIIGIKDSGGNLVKMGTIIQACSKDYQFLAGSASFLLPALSIGAVGGILALANIAPAKCLKIYSDFKSANYKEARKLQLEMISVNTAITAKWGVPALKYLMDNLGLYGGPARGPILPVAESIKELLKDIVEKEGILPIQ